MWGSKKFSPLRMVRQVLFNKKITPKTLHISIVEGVCCRNIPCIVCYTKSCISQVATFVFSPFPIYVDSTAVLPRHKSTMIVKVNLQQRKLVSADLDQGARCSLSDAVVLLAHYIININHPKMHAYANWGIDPEADTGYLQKMSVVTACYNHYGYTNFPQMANNMVRKGAGACFGICLRESLKSGVKRHAQVVQLAQHSKLIDFIVRLRAPFKQAFSLCRQDFSPNISCSEKLSKV